MNFRCETPEDALAIHHINTAAFARPEEARLVDALRSSTAWIPELSLVAEQEGVVVGHILFTRCHIQRDAGGTVDCLALAPMAVLPENQGAGIGSRLVQEGLAQAKALGHGAVIVLGHEHYYPRFGFLPASRWKVRAPFPVPDAAFMAMELNADALADAEGVVVYAEAFGGV